MFDFSIGKVAILFALCLIVLGPEKLPKLAAQLGRFAGQARAMARHFRNQLEQEIAAEELKKEIKAADDAIAKLAAETPPPVARAEVETEADKAAQVAPSSTEEETESPSTSSSSGGADKPSANISA